jgi:hypothetical protein
VVASSWLKARAGEFFLLFDTDQYKAGVLPSFCYSSVQYFEEIKIFVFEVIREWAIFFLVYGLKTVIAEYFGIVVVEMT